MLHTHRLCLPELPGLSEETPEQPAARLAVAGGSSRQPPDEGSGSATIIPFPSEPRRAPSGRTDPLSPWPEDSPEPPAGDQDGGTPAAGAADSEPLWPHWMAHVLTRYRAPDGSSGGAGVFI
jgi:hypothetical protein